MVKGTRRLGMGKHTSIPHGLKDSIDDLASHEYVTRIILGRFHPRGTRFPNGHLKYQTDTQSGIKVNGYASGGVLEIFARIHPLDKRQVVIDYINQTYVK